MFFKKSLQFLDNACKKAFLMQESKLVYMKSPEGPKAPEAAKKAPESADDKKRLAILSRLKLVDQYQKGIDKYIGDENSHEIEVKSKIESKDVNNYSLGLIDSVNKYAKPSFKKEKEYKIFIKSLETDISVTIERNMGLINKHLPVTISIGPGSQLAFVNEKQNFSLVMDLKINSPLASLYKEQLRAYDQAKKNKEKGREKVKTSSKEKLSTVKGSVKESQLLDQSKSKYLKKKGNIYVVDFKGKGKRIDRNAEKNTRIHDLLDLSRLKGGNMYVRIHLDGVSRAGIRHKYWAYYHPSQETFIKEGTTDRALIFHGTKIDKIEYKYRKPKKAKMPKVAPTEVKAKEKPQVSERKRRLERKFKILQANWDSFYGKEAYVMQNKRFSVPKTLQDDSDFKKYWGRVSRPLEAALARAPFNLTTTEARRKYIQDVIQEDLNSRLYAEDFFEYKVNGKELYKGGYKKFIKDYTAIDRKMAELGMDFNNPRNAEERKLAKQWIKVESIAIGIAKIFDALSKASTVPRTPETNKDRYQTKLVGIKQISSKELEKLGNVQYHSLDSLLHKRDNAPAGIDIGINTDLTNEIKGQVIEQEAPDLNVRQLLKSKGGLKLMFMAFGLNNLIKRGCIKRLDNTHYVLVKIPKRGWGEALGTLSQNKAKLHDPSKENFKKWEAIRASLDQGRQARNFILKIFKPSGSTVKQNINWWKKLWHWDFKNKKKITMAYLGTATLDPKALEKHVATDRGYLDMMEKTSKRVEGTSLYEPQKSEVLKLSNKYLEYGLIATFMNAKQADAMKIAKQLLTEFNIEGQVKLQKFDTNEHKMENVKEIYKAIALKGLDSTNLTKAHVRMIRMGYVLGRQVETANNWNEVMAKNLSNKPLYRAIQMKALQNGAPIYKLKEIEQRIHFAIFGLSQSERVPGAHKFNVRGGGAAVAIELGEWAGQKWHISVGAAGVDGKFMPFAEVGAAIKLGKKVKLRWSVGTTIGFSGAAAAVEFPVTSEWDMYAGVSAGADWKGRAGVGAGLGAKWNKYRAEKIRERKALSDRSVKDIEAAIDSNNPKKAAELILKNPTFGAYVKALKNKFTTSTNPNGLSNETIVDIYQNAKTEWLNAARRGVKIPVVTGFGAGVFAGVSANPLESGISLGAYVTFTIPGTKVNYVIRHEHPKYSEYVQSKVAQEALKAKLLKASGGGKYVIAKQTISATSGIVYFDSRLGRSHVARPNGTAQMKKSIAVKDREETANIAGKKSFSVIKRTFANLDMDAKLVKDPKNPKNTLLAITPLQTQGSNVEMLIDPELRSKGIILDKANNRILLAASEAQRLYVTRTKYRYPFARKGAMNLEVISFKTNPNRSNLEIREDSPRYIYKYKGEKYAMVRGEARTGIPETQSNTMTLDQYKQRKNKYESFTDSKLEFSLRESKGITNKMSDAIGYRGQEVPRFNQLRLGNFAKRFFDKNQRWFDANIGKADTIAKEAAFKTKCFGRLKGDFKRFAKEVLKNPNISLNENELNLVYTYMLNESFVKLASRSDAIVDRRLKKRNELFKAHVKNYVRDFMKNNPIAWKEIKAIDPSVTPESIANYLALTMPQNAKQFRAFLKRKQLPLDAGLKFASYTRKYGNEAFAMSYGMKMPEEFNKLFKLVGPTRLKLDSPNPRERAAARLILQVMSPLSTNTETVEGKKKFLTSELSLLLISMVDDKTGISPMIEILGKKHYQGMTAIYKALKEGNLAQAVQTHATAFAQFKTLVMGVRAAQLNAEPTYVYKNKFVFHLKNTEVYSGPYLKCGNGTIAARQRIGVAVRRVKRGQWYGAKTARNISVIPNERVKAGSITAGWAHTFKQKQRPTKRPPEDRKPPKLDAPERSAPGESGSNTGGTAEVTGPAPTESAY